MRNNLLWDRLSRQFEQASLGLSERKSALKPWLDVLRNYRQAGPQSFQSANLGRFEHRIQILFDLLYSGVPEAVLAEFIDNCLLAIVLKQSEAPLSLLLGAVFTQGLLLGKHPRAIEADLMSFLNLPSNAPKPKKNQLLVQAGESRLEGGWTAADGPLLIKGNLEVVGDIQGVTIEVEGNVMVHGSLFGCSLSATGWLRLDGGILGCTDKLIKAFKLDCGFLHRARLSIQDDVIVRGPSVDVDAECQGQWVSAGPLGDVRGGRVWAGKEVCVENAGHGNAVATTLACAADATVTIRGRLFPSTRLNIEPLIWINRAPEPIQAVQATAQGMFIKLRPL